MWVNGRLREREKKINDIDFQYVGFIINFILFLIFYLNFIFMINFIFYFSKIEMKF